MAGGMDWFRWHHGSITDPKFQLIARRSESRFGDVLAVWTFVLESASASHDRGSFGEIDCEAVDCLIGAEEGTTSRIIEAMVDRGLVEFGRVTAWDKRQPKREREDNSSGRVKAFRQKQHQETPHEAEEGNVTPCNATQRQETPRREEKREETKHTSSASPAGFAEFWDAYPKKVGKIAAMKAWRRCKADLGDVINAINRQKSCERWTKQGGEFIPNPATWINEGRWEDECTFGGDWAQDLAAGGV